MSVGSAEHSYVYNYPFRVVARAYLAKYPHPDLSHVESVDTLERYVDEEGVLYTTRVLTTSFLKFSSVAGFEQSTVDLDRGIVQLRTRSLNYTSLAKTYEECCFVREGPDHTQFTIKCNFWITSLLGFMMGSALSTFNCNFKKGTEALEDIIHCKLGVPFFKTFQDFTDMWAKLTDFEGKFKLLKKAVKEVDILAYAKAEVLSDVLKTLAKQRGDIEVTYLYISRIVEIHSTETLQSLARWCDKEIIEKLLNKLKENYQDQVPVRYFDDLRDKFGLKIT